jgi:preprotein translocase subunit SecD
MVYGEKEQMRFSARMWVLFVFLIISVISIINIPSTNKLLFFLILLTGLVTISLVKSKKYSIFVLIVMILVCYFFVINSFQSGVLVQSISSSDSFIKQGLKRGDIIQQVNGKTIISVADFYKDIQISNNSGNIRMDIVTENGDFTSLINKTPEITVTEIPLTNIKTGLDISGGARALVQPTTQISDQDLQDLISVSRERLNVFGLADVQIKGASDLEGNRFMLVEVAGATPDDLESLISEQGKFEAKIGNKTVFVGGDKDITHVFRNDATQSAVYLPEKTSDGTYVSRFSFGITLSPEAAQRHATITKDISVDPISGGQYLSENLSLVLDGEVIDVLRISTGLKGQVTSQISIQGSGQGNTQQEALDDARSSMNKLQTILISGSLPFELEIVKLDTISPALGQQFNYAIILAGVSAILSVSILIFIRYRKFKISMALLLVSFSEIIIILGIASIIKWNLDLASIAGILATIGTGVDQQIVIVDESRLGNKSNLKENMKKAIFIVMSAYFTALASLLPLFKAGAGLFKGFAITTLIGITAGVFITRPAFADMIKRMNE